MGKWARENVDPYFVDSLIVWCGARNEAPHWHRGFYLKVFLNTENTWFAPSLDPWILTIERRKMWLRSCFTLKPWLVRRSDVWSLLLLLCQLYTSTVLWRMWCNFPILVTTPVMWLLALIYNSINLSNVAVRAGSFVVAILYIAGCCTEVPANWIPLYLSSDTREICRHCQCSLLRNNSEHFSN